MMLAIALGPRWLRVMLLLICAVPLSKILITFSADQGRCVVESDMDVLAGIDAFRLLFTVCT